MEETEELFIPDYSYTAQSDVISDNSSILRCGDEHAYVSIDNKINQFNTKSMEVEATFAGHKKRVTAFLPLKNHIVIGYEQGVVECISPQENARVFITRPHKKTVTDIVETNDGFISSSKDGTICHYLLEMNVIKHYYTGNTSTVCSLASTSEYLLASTTENTVIVWKTNEPQTPSSVLAFESRIVGLCARGSVALVVLNGASYFVDLSTNEKSLFSNFKKVIAVSLFGDHLCVLLPRKAVIYAVKDNMKLSMDKQVEISDDVFSMCAIGDRLVYITRNNEIGVVGEKTGKGQHHSEIIWMGRSGESVFTVSKEMVAMHRVGREDKYEDLPEKSKVPVQNEYARFDPSEMVRLTVEPALCAPLENALCAEIFGDQLLIGTNEGLQVYTMGFLEKTREIETEKLYAIAAHGDVCALCTDDSAIFLNRNFEEIGRFTCNDRIVFARFSPDGRLFAISSLDNKIHVYDFQSLTLKCSLYGHSLPVRHFSISKDSSLLVSCGTDKLVKLWGLQFGECRKSLLIDASAVECSESDLFIASASKELLYYRGFKQIKKYKCYSPRFISYGDGYMVVTSGFGVAIYSENKYELSDDSESDDEPAFVSTKTYSMDFYDYLDKVEETGTHEASWALYELVERLDISELESYLCILDSRAVCLLLAVIGKFVDKNIIVNSRVFLALFRYHKNTCLEYPGFYEIQRQLKERMHAFRDVIGDNEAVLSMCVNYGVIDTDF